MQQEKCRLCAQSTVENWLKCETCNKWTHSHCMGYSSTEFKFLERATNFNFMCNGRSASGVKRVGKRVMGHHSWYGRIEGHSGKAKSVIKSLYSLATAPKVNYLDVFNSGNKSAHESVSAVYLNTKVQLEMKRNRSSQEFLNSKKKPHASKEIH